MRELNKVLWYEKQRICRYLESFDKLLSLLFSVHDDT